MARVLSLVALVLSLLSVTEKVNSQTLYAEYESEYEVTSLTELSGSDVSINARATSPPSNTVIVDAEAQYRAAYICLDVQRMLCLGVSPGDALPVWDPNNLNRLQVKRRERNEMRGTDWLKMRWEIEVKTGIIRLASVKTLCIARMSLTDMREIILRPCEGAPPALLKWNIPFSAENDDDDKVGISTGMMSLQAYPNQCMTLMKCLPSAQGHCDSRVDQPYTVDLASLDTSLLSGAYVKLSPCSTKSPNQLMRQIRNCAPGCSTFLTENSVCDAVCQNPECDWDNGACPALPLPTDSPTEEPTGSPSAKPTEMPSRNPTTNKPSKTPSVASPTASPSTTRPTVSPSTTRPTRNPTREPSSAAPTRKPSGSPTLQPSKPPTTRPTASPSKAKPSAGPTAHPSSQVPSHSPSHNVSGLAGIPVEEDVVAASSPWWAWLILSLLLSCIISLCLAILCVQRRRRERERQERETAQRRATKMLGDPDFDVEMGVRAGSKRSSFKSAPPQTPNSDKAIRRPPPPPPLPTRDMPIPPTIVSFSAPSPAFDDEEAKRRRKEEDQEEKAKKSARRSVIKLMNAMTDLEDAFAVADKEMDNVHNHESQAGDGIVQVPLMENASPNRVSGSTPSKRRSTPHKHQLHHLERKETNDLVTEMKSRKLEQAIAKVEKAIGALERKVNHEQIRLLDGDEHSIMSGNTHGDLDTTVGSIETHGTLMDSRLGDNPTYIVSRSSRGTNPAALI